ncbi:ABC transporter permease [Balneolaceae bacterium ANBcel3]|nr:ABC transporter permease [Balneolaceae bacterium ANBcel3]
MKNLVIFFEIVIREFRRFLKNKVALAIFLGAPLLYGPVFGLLYTDAQLYDTPVVVVDYDRSPLSDRITDALNEQENIAVSAVHYEEFSLQNGFIQGEYYAIVVIPEGFEAGVLQKRTPEIRVDVNASNMVITNYTVRAIQQVLATMDAGVRIETLKREGVPPQIAEERHQAFSINYQRYFNPSNNYLIFLLPGLLGMVLQQVFLLVLAISFSQEFEERTFSQLTDKTRSAFLLLLSKTFPYWVIGMLMWLLSLHGILYYFGVPVDGRLPGIYLFSLLFVMSMSSIGILVSVAIPSQLKATEILMVVAAPAFLISGFTWPLYQMPDSVQYIASLIPTTHFLEGFRKMILAGARLEHLQSEVLALVLLTMIPYLFTLLIIKIRIGKTCKESKMEQA